VEISFWGGNGGENGQAYLGKSARKKGKRKLKVAKALYWLERRKKCEKKGTCLKGGNGGSVPKKQARHTAESKKRKKEKTEGKIPLRDTQSRRKKLGEEG